MHTHHAGKFVSIQGTVVRVGNVKPLVTKMAFKCSLCHGTQVLALPDGKYTLPTKVGWCISSPSFHAFSNLEATSALLGELPHSLESFLLSVPF